MVLSLRAECWREEMAMIRTENSRLQSLLDTISNRLDSLQLPQAAAKIAKDDQHSSAFKFGHRLVYANPYSTLPPQMTYPAFTSYHHISASPYSNQYTSGASPTYQQQPMHYSGFSSSPHASAPLAAAVPPAAFEPKPPLGAEGTNINETEVIKEVEVLKEKDTAELRQQKDGLLKEFAVVEEKKNVPSLTRDVVELEMKVQVTGKAIHQLYPPPQAHRLVEDDDDDDVNTAVELEMKEELKQKFEGLPFQLSGIITENFKVLNEVREDDQTVNPWTVSAKEGGKIGYDKLIDKFECQKLNQNLIDRIQRVPGRTPNVFLRRGVFFARRDLNEILDAYENEEGVFSDTGWYATNRVPVDGCSIFGRTSKFKLLSEEGIEFNKLGLRDNNAQICVRESVQQSPMENRKSICSSSSCRSGLLNQFKSDGGVLEEMVKERFRVLTLKYTLKPVLIPCYDLPTSSPFLFSRADALTSDSFDFELAEVSRATTVDPGVFGFKPGLMTAIDGRTKCVVVGCGVTMMAAAITHALHNKQEFPFVRGVEDPVPESDDRISHICNILRFCILKEDRAFTVIRGPWHDVEGRNPSVDDSSLVQTALRHVKHTAQFDLQKCQHWNRFLEIHYDQISKGGLFSHKGVTVLYVPDLSEFRPSLDTWKHQWIEHQRAVAEMGGSTFDVSLLTVEEGIFEIKATAELIESIPMSKETMPHLKAVCFLRPTPENIQLLYHQPHNPSLGEYYLFFSNILEDAQIHNLADSDEHEAVPPNLQSYCDRAVDGLASLFLALKRRPVIQYQRTSDITQRVAQVTAELMYQQESGLFDFRRMEISPLLLVIDRRDDPVTPLLNQWTYQAMVHELIGIKDNKVDLRGTGKVPKDQEEVVLSSQQDAFFERNMYENSGDIGTNTKKMVDEFQHVAKSNHSIQTIEDMAKFVDNYPEYRKIHGDVSKHVTIVTELSKIVGERKLMLVSETEQELACSVCYQKSERKTEYVRIDKPMMYQEVLKTFHHAQEIGGHGHKFSAPEPYKPIPDPYARIPSKPVPLINKVKLSSRFISDVKVMDGTVMAPSVCFTKIWRMKNTGNVVWPIGTQLVRAKGKKFSDALSVDLEIPADGLPVDSELDVAMNFVASELPGEYVSYWRMSSRSGQEFGHRIWGVLQVDKSHDQLSDGFRKLNLNLNLNLPPQNNGVKGLVALLAACPLVGSFDREVETLPTNASPNAETLVPLPQSENFSVSMEHEELSEMSINQAERYNSDNGQSRTQVLVQWEVASESDATWEELDALRAEFPEFNLEVEVGLDGRSNDTNLQDRAAPGRNAQDKIAPRKYEAQKEKGRTGGRMRKKSTRCLEYLFHTGSSPAPRDPCNTGRPQKPLAAATN